MTDKPTQGFWEHIRLWLSAIGLPVVLALAGLWQFYLKEVWWPESAINLTTEVSIKQVGLSAGGADASKNLEALEVAITAQNPSTRTVYLCANYWAAWGIKVGTRTEPNENWSSDVSGFINKRKSFVAGRHFRTEPGTLVAVGNVFVGDDYLRSQEKVSAAFVFYVPQGVYDLIKVFAILPSTTATNPGKSYTSALGITYAPDSNGLSIVSIDQLNGDRSEGKLALEKGEPKYASDVTRYGYQVTLSHFELSLWQSKPPAK